MRIKIKLLILIFVAMTVIGCDLIEDIEEKNIELLRHLNANRVDQIDILKQQESVKKITTGKEIKQFIDSLKDLKKYHPNHPRYSEEWFVVIKMVNGDVEKLYLMKEKNDQENLYVNSLGHRWLGGGGTATSLSLYKWMVENKLVKNNKVVH